MAKVLLVTQEGSFGRKLSNLNSAHGIESDLCDGLGDAILRLRDHHYRAVVVDVEEGTVAPAETIGTMKAISPGISIIAIIDKNRLELEKDIREQGVFYYLVKPVEDREYLDAVNQALEYSNSCAV
jgi:DNA-binding NtrC family response regulator